MGCSIARRLVRISSASPRATIAPCRGRAAAARRSTRFRCRLQIPRAGRGSEAGGVTFPGDAGVLEHVNPVGTRQREGDALLPRSTVIGAVSRRPERRHRKRASRRVAPLVERLHLKGRIWVDVYRPLP